MKSRFLVIGMAIAMMLIAGQSVADTIGPDCPNGSCFGNTFTLSYDSIGTDLYRVTLTIDTSGFVPVGNPEWLNSVSIKIAPQDSDYLSIATVSYPINWTSSISPPFNGFMTDTNTSATQFNLPDGTLGWVWDIGIATGKLFTDPDQASIKAEYLRPGPQPGQIHQRNTSEDITLQLQGKVPEPTTMLLLGSGLLGLWGFRKKFQK